MQETINIVWFKKDLRLTDHSPLADAIKSGEPILLLHFFEPTLMDAADSDERHWRFIYESVDEIKRKLHQHQLYFFSLYTEVLPFLQQVSKSYNIKAIYSHQETGNAISFERDNEVNFFSKKNKIQWNEYPSNGIIRGIKNRNKWSERWKETMTSLEQTISLSAIQSVQLPHALNSFNAFDTLAKKICRKNPLFQPGGETAAWRYLHSFLNERCTTYSKHISKPEESRISCSRISPYLTYGNVSMKQVYRATLNAMGQSFNKRSL